MNPWDDEVCGICFRGFTERSWENRHSIPSWHLAHGRDCHAKCCPSAWCKEKYQDAHKAKPKAKPEAIR